MPGSTCGETGGWGLGCAQRAGAAAAAAAHRLPARVLDGRAVAAAWQEELAREVRDVYAKGGRPPGLGVVLVGSRPDSLLYVTRKREACERVGVFAEVRQLSASVTQRQLEDAVAALCADPRIDGVLVQLPLPRHIDEEAIIESFDPQKDVDGFHPLNMGRILMRGRAARFIPCTALGVIELLQRSGVAVHGRNVVVMGDSNIVGMPLAMLFRDAGAATVTVLHRTSYRELFNDATSSERANQRAAAAACLPRIPGPVVAHAAGFREAAAQPAAEEAAAPHPYQVDYSSSLRDAYRPQGAQQQQQQQAGGAAAPAYAGHHAHAPHDDAHRSGGSGWQRSNVVGGQGRAHHPQVPDLPGITRTADILVVAVGYPKLVKGDWVKPGAVVIDVGINVVDREDGGSKPSSGSGSGLNSDADWTEEQGGAGGAGGAEGSANGAASSSSGSGSSGGVSPPSPPAEYADFCSEGYEEEGQDAQPSFHVVGDVDFCDVAEVASALTPVPGGVGPMTIAAVLHNTVQAARHHLGLAGGSGGGGGGG
ncbi:bifunctional 2-like [Micractinium conductrix]|uniref:methenyltetrahydrofolate cyclohydrolase n=1 Tax=Micractinium conductrix TaxID=554055 RepID=A0A2P6VFI1_9CHLO|nr:bifunctional 2-like [Micractinium conductrix]|eukprot:PSC72850.1 bifunctional 2-like [Micractinium conductrix]